LPSLRGDQLAETAWTIARGADPDRRGMRVPELQDALRVAGYEIVGDNPRSTLGVALNRAQRLWDHPRYATWVWLRDASGRRPEVSRGLSGLELSREANAIAKRLDPDRRDLTTRPFCLGLGRAGIDVRGPNRGQTLLNALWRQVDFERPERGRWRWR
jgi:hypothetical protein